MQGEYIKRRLLPRIVEDICEQRDIVMTALSEDWLLRLERENRVQWVVGYQFGLNSASGLQIAADKVATYLALSLAGIDAVPHYLVKSAADQTPRLRDTGLAENAAYVLKPLKGTSGKNITIHSSLSQALDAAAHSTLAELALSPYVDIVEEYRLIALDDRLLLAYAKTNPVSINRLAMFNLAHGATTQPFTPDSELVATAIHAAKQCELRLAAVDIVRLQDGHTKVIEVNSGVMLEHYARLSKQHHAQAFSLYDTIIARMFDM